MSSPNGRHPPLVACRPVGLASLGSDSVFLEPYKIRSPHRVTIGDRVTVGERSFLSVVEAHMGREHDPGLTIGSGTSIGPDFFVHCAGRVEIGSGVTIEARVFIGDSGRDYSDPDAPYSELQIDDPDPVRIGDHARLGVGAIVLAGVNVGAGAVVTPGSVVTRDVPAGAVVRGNPARVMSRPSVVEP